MAGLEPHCNDYSVFLFFLLTLPCHVRHLINRGRRLLTLPFHVRRLIEGGAYSRTALINTSFPCSALMRVNTINVKDGDKSSLLDSCDCIDYFRYHLVVVEQ